MPDPLDPSEVFPLDQYVGISRHSVIALLRAYDDSAAASGAEWACQVLASLDPGTVERRVLDVVSPGAGQFSVTAAVISECIAALQEAVRAST